MRHLGRRLRFLTVLEESKWGICGRRCFLSPAAAAAQEDIVFVADVDGTKQRYVQVLPPDFDREKPVEVLIATD